VADHLRVRILKKRGRTQIIKADGICACISCIACGGKCAGRTDASVRGQFCLAARTAGCQSVGHERFYEVKLKR
jgi:hypothetical protein